ncbi:MAG: DNA repair protein RecO [Gammaproteobacteria bacterium]|nr:DNA repair protein RecO [Gammaproteobacteria bacterium]MDP2349322.1 DNA repair protein RecO [Gammaproteobacteria bacterium]
MTAKIDLQPAYVLHTHPFQNTSLLVDFFCLDYGRIRAVAKGARRPKSRTRALLQPFHPLLVTLAGRSELKNLISVEGSVNAFNLQGPRLFSGMYLNELLVRLLHFNDEHTQLYQAYQQTIIGLHGDRDLSQLLRCFELELLNSLGYGLNREVDCNTGDTIEPDALYLFHPDIGFERILGSVENRSNNPGLFSGTEILSLSSSNPEDKATNNAARRLTRIALQAHLGDKPLVSRELFLKQRES